MTPLRGITLLAGTLLAFSGCATLDTSNLSSACRQQYNACLDSCQPPSRLPSRQPTDSVQGQSESLTPDTQTPGCVDDCNRQAKTCS
ncbi:hypothetical protein [Corallococcus llansteffanensis]|uniref:Lipoprotein n=1 Tax=Corallococcus llansteffanensis TaxID=2316731 RepID=A0A3A8NJV0_9BACT|nr:hypothetical protein [Corallococcus llansteffanensis]RKH42451.1 hypothetical protein D7V93_37815 [Corallococcus llansteffanensis]